MTIDLNMLPAENGDCLVLTYGTGTRHHILIDGGTEGTEDALRGYLETIPEASRHFDLIVLTHIDNDHIGGMLKLLEDPPAGFGFDDFWFNAFHHLAPEGLLGEPALNAGEGMLGVAEGEALTAYLLESKERWNKAFDHKAVVVPADPEPLPRIPLGDGATITLLSPTIEKLESLRHDWKAWLDAHGQEPYKGDPLPGQEESVLGTTTDLAALAGRTFHSDSAPNNGSSIAFLFQWGDKTILFGADAHPKVLKIGLERLCGENGQPRLELDALKLPHHGSKANCSPALLDCLSSKRFLISTNGAVSSHPDDETLARIITAMANPTFYFNYAQDRSNRWGKWQQAGAAFRMVFPRTGCAGLLVKV